MQVFGTFGPHRASLYTVLADRRDPEIPHGLRVVSDRGWLREASVYDHGTLVRQYQFHRSGMPFITRHIDAAGNGHEQIQDPTARILFTGFVQAAQRYSGEFLVIEFIPGTYGRRRFVVRRYEAGNVVNERPFPFDAAGVAAPDDEIEPTNWPWSRSDWPKADS